MFNNIWQDLRLIKVMDIIDILIVAFCVYQLFRLSRGTGVQHLMQALLILFGALLISGWLELNIINYFLLSVFQIGVLALIILFQPELRKILQQFGNTHRFKLFRQGEKAEYLDLQLAIHNTVNAACAMAKEKVGALIVFERSDNISSVANSGTHIDAEISTELVKNIFYPKSPLHDGAVIITNGRVRSAGCILPLSANRNISKELGTRHRAALGMSEAYDSISVVVSEETGAISLAIGGVLKRHLSPDTLEKLLLQELLPKADGADKHLSFFKMSVSEWLKGRGNNEGK